MLITDPPGIDPSQLRERMEGRVSAPGDTDWDEARQAWNLAVDQRPAAVAMPATRRRRRRRRRRSPASAACASPPRAPATTPAPIGTLDDTILVKTARAARRRDRRRARASPASRPARCGSTSPSPPPSTASPRWPARRPTSASSATRSAAACSWLGRKHGLAANSVLADRARHRRRRARARRPATTMPSCSGRCAAAAATSASSPPSSSSCIPLPDGLRRHDAVAVGARRRGPQGLGRVDPRRRPTRSRPCARLIQVPPLPDIPEFLARPRRSWSIDGAYLGDEAAPRSCSPRCARSGPRWTRSPRWRRAACSLHPHGPRGADARHAATARCSTSSTAEAIDALVARRRRRLRHAAADGRAAPARRRARPLRRAPRRARRRCAGEFALFAVGIPMTPEVGAAVDGALPTLDRRDGAVGRRHGVHELRRARRRPGDVLLRRGLRPPAPHQGRGRPHRSVPRKPRNLRGLIAVEPRALLRSSPVGSEERRAS